MPSHRIEVSSVSSSPSSAKGGAHGSESSDKEASDRIITDDKPVSESVNARKKDPIEDDLNEDNLDDGEEAQSDHGNESDVEHDQGNQGPSGPVTNLPGFVENDELVDMFMGYINSADGAFFLYSFA